MQIPAVTDLVVCLLMLVVANVYGCGPSGDLHSPRESLIRIYIQSISIHSSLHVHTLTYLLT